MSDVLQLASKYRNRLKAELARVEEFLRMAEELSKGGDLESRLPFTNGNGEAAKADSRPGESKSAESRPTDSRPAEAKAKPAEEPKTPFDRFRAAGN